MSHVLRVGQADQIAYFRAYNTDGSGKTDLTSSTTGLTLSVFRIGASSVSISSLSNKAADNTAHADGAIRAVGGNLYTIDLPDAACANQVPSICVRGTYTGGVIEGLEHPIVAYDPSVVAVGANTTTPPTAAANASQVRTELTTELARIDVATSTRLASASYTAPPTAAANADAVWDEAMLGHTTNDTYGAHFVRSANKNQNTVQITGSQYIASDLHQCQTDVIDSDALASSAVAEIQGALVGSGARVVSITVFLDGVAQQSARVRLTKGAETYITTTNISGLATFNVDDGTWIVSITLAGATFAGASLVVDGNETVSYSLTANPAISASDPDKVTGYWLCLSHLGVPESGVTVTITAMSLPANSTGIVLDSASRSAVSGVDGVVSFTNLIPGVRYKVVRNSGTAFYFVCPAYQSDPVDLASFIGT